MAKATCILVSGPESDWDSRIEEEVPVWYVGCADDDGLDVGKVYSVRTYFDALELGRRMSRDRGLELVNDACPA